MPWDKIGDVPPQVKSHKGVPLNIAQANKWAEIYDAIKDDQSLENPVAVAWTTWEKLYIIENGKWVERKEEGNGKTLSDGVNAILCNRNGKMDVQSVVFDKDKFTEDQAVEWLKEHDFKNYTSRETENQIRFRQFPPDECDGGFSNKTKDFMESVLFISDAPLEVIKGKDSDSMIIHGVAVTTNVSNSHRFPLDVLERDIVTLIGQPLVEGHSMWPMDVEVKDIYGQVIDAWVNTELKRAEFFAEVWNENYKRVLSKMPHRVKFSVGFKHDYDIEEDSEVHISNSAFFDHIGTTNRPADIDSILLGVKSDAKVRGRSVISFDGKAFVVHSNDEKKEGGNDMPEEKTESKQDIEEPKTEAPAEEPKSEEPKTDVPKDEAPPAPEPPAPVESEKGMDEKVEKRLEDAEKTLEQERKARQELESKVRAYETAEKHRKVSEYVDECIDHGIKMPSQKDALVNHYMTFTEEQMKREIELNKIGSDLSSVFGESAKMSEDAEKTEEVKVPERKNIT